MAIRGLNLSCVLEGEAFASMATKVDQAIGDAARAKGTSATVLIGNGMQHDWPLTLPWLHESRLAWNAMRTFVEEHSRCSLAGYHGISYMSSLRQRYDT